MITLFAVGVAPSVAAQSEPAGFSLGVASGDVTPSDVVLWTRADTPGNVAVEVAADEQFTAIIAQAQAAATAATDQCVKFDVPGLAPATPYFYRFRRGDDPSVVSRTGRFRTAAPPDAPSALRFLFSGDTNAAHAPFGVAGMAAREEADLFIWFGDTIYADAGGGGLAPARSLDEYRAKYRQVRSDPGIRDLLARMALLAGWDDHEVVNDYAGLDPALSALQRDAGYRAFFEYMPIRPIRRADGAAFQTYRRFRFGAHVDIFATDGRQYRAESAASRCGYQLDPYGLIVGPLLNDDSAVEVLKRPREMLGAEQFAWLTSGLAASTASNKFVLNNVPMTFLGVFPYDRWDGYDRQRRALLESIDRQATPGVVVLTTDIHANAYNPDVGDYFRRHRPDYRLPGRAAVPELIVGPLGNETAFQSAFEIASAVLRAPNDDATRRVVEALGTGFTDRVAAANGLAFFETHRVAYLVVDVAGDGGVTFAYRGAEPESAGDPAGEPETFFTGAIDRAVRPAPCGALVLPALGMAWVGARRAVRRRPPAANTGPHAAPARARR